MVYLMGIYLPKRPPMVYLRGIYLPKRAPMVYLMGLYLPKRAPMVYLMGLYLPVIELRPTQRLRTGVGNSSLVYRYAVPNDAVAPNFP